VGHFSTNNKGRYNFFSQPQAHQTKTAIAAAKTTADKEPPLQAPLPRSHRPPQAPADSVVGFISRIAEYFGRNERATSAVLIGASAAPMLVGIPTEALAQNIEQPSATVVPEIITNTSAETRSGTTFRLSDYPGPINNTFEAIEIHVLNTQNIRLKGLHEAVLRARMDRMSIDNHNNGSNNRTGANGDLIILDKLLSRITDVINYDGKVPGNLVSDMTRVVSDVLAAPEGALSDVFARHPVFGTSGLNGPTVISALPSLETNSNALYRFMNADLGSVTAGVSDVARIYNLAAENTIDRIPSIPNSSWTTSTDSIYTDPSGNSYFLRAGSQFEVNNNEITIFTPTLDAQISGTNVRLDNATIRLGNASEAFELGSFEYRDSSNNILFENFELSADRANSIYTLAGSNANIDIAGNTVRFTDGRLVAGVNGDANGNVNNLNIDTSGVELSANEISFDLRSNTDSSTELNLNITNGRIGTDEINADIENGNVRLVSNPDGSSRMIASVTDLNTSLTETGISTTGLSSIDLRTDVNGNLSAASLFADTARVSTNSTDVNVTNGSLNLTFDTSGRINSANGSGNSVTVNTKSGAEFNAKNGILNASFHANGNLKDVAADAAIANYSSSAGNFNASEGKLTANITEDGQVRRLWASGDAQWNGTNGYKLNSAGTTVDLRFGENDNLSTARVISGEFTATLPGGEEIRTKDTSANAIFDTSGQLREIKAKTGNVTYQNEDENRSVSISGIDGHVFLSESGGLQQATVATGEIDYSDNNTSFKTSGQSRISTNYGSTGEPTRIDVSSDGIQFTRTSKKDHDISVNATDVNVSFVRTSDGQESVLSAKNAVVNIDGHNIDMGDAANLNLKADENGVIYDLAATFPDKVEFEHRNGELGIRAKNLNVNASHVNNSTTINASFEEGHVVLRGEGLTANIKDANLSVTDGQARMHVSSATVLKSVGERFNVDVEGMDLVVDYSDRGIQGLDLQVEGVEGSVKEVNFWVRSENGDRIRLNMEADENGDVIKRAFLKIPNGGEIEVNHEDFSARLGPQTISFINDNGSYRLRAEGMDINVATKDAKVRVTGGTAEVALNKESGELIINEITGTDVNVNVGGRNIDINIDELNGYIARTTGELRGTDGASIHLVPTSTASRINMEVRTKLSGIPVKLDIDNAYEFKSFARLSENNARFYVGDPSGRGNVRLSAGPLSLKGSAIEVAARYEAYDSNRMTSILGRIFTRDGINITKNLVVEPDGIVRLGTVDSPVVAEVSVILPKGTGSTPAYIFDVGNGASDAAPGVLGRIGARGIHSGDAEYTGSIFVGAVPASYLEVTQPKGDATLFGAPMPKRFTVPTTGVAGVTLERNTDDLNVRLDVGGFVNPAALAPSSIPLSESTTGGFFTGLRVEKENFETGVDAVIEIDNGGNARFGGARWTFGVRF